MRRQIVWSVVLVFGLVVAIAACGSLQKPVVLEAKKDYVVNVKIIDHKFDPNNFQIYQRETLILRLENMTSKNHNFTIKKPNGELFQGVDIPANKTLDAKLLFEQSGIYKFYSNKFTDKMHGMKGQIVVIAR